MMRGTFDPVTHTYRIDGKEIPSNTQILADVGLIDASWYTEGGRMRGTAVHAACHFLDEDALDWNSVDPFIEPYVRAYEKFKVESGFVPDLIEVPLFQYTYKYGTTIDRTGHFSSGEEVLIDLKSGLVEPWVGLQLAGQNECLPLRLSRYALQLKSDGSYRLQQFRDPNDRNLFLAAVAICHFKRNHGGKNANEFSNAA